MSLPTVSVVLPTYNRSRLLRRAMASVLGQGFRDLELLVVDDRSQEDIGAVVRSFNDPRARHLRRETQGGPAGARNTGLAAARGTWIAFQDSDDEWLTDKLEFQLAEISRDPELALHSCGMIRHGNKALYSFPEPAMRRDGRITPFVAQMNPVAFTQTWVARRQLLVDLGGFDETLRVWDDWDLFMRAAEHHPIRISSRPLVVSHVTPGSVGRDLDRRVWDLNIFVRKYQDHPSQQFRARLHYLLARYKTLTGDAEGARQSSFEALKLNPRAAKAWMMAGLAALPRPIWRSLANRSLQKNE